MRTRKLVRVFAVFFGATFALPSLSMAGDAATPTGASVTRGAIRKNSNGLHFSWSAGGNSPMNVERTSSLDGYGWSNIALGITNGQFTDPNPPTNAAFYRAVTPPAARTTFNYTGSTQVYRVPTGIERLNLVAVGGSGNGVGPEDGGRAAYVTGAISVSPGDLIHISVGARGQGRVNWHPYPDGKSAFKGGGASDIRIGGTNLEHRVFVAGGGGGDGPSVFNVNNGTSTSPGKGGNAGLNGEAGTEGFPPFKQWDVWWAATGGGGGTQTNGGEGGGNPLTWYHPKSPSGQLGLGGFNGGDGYYGGGGGGPSQSGSAAGGGGGGGSSFADTNRIQNAFFAASPTKGNGYVIVALPTPTPPAETNNMILVTGGALSGIAVPTFQLGKYEVTWDEWQEVRDWGATNGYSDLANAGQGSAGNHPVRNVSLFAVLKWMNARSEKEGLAPAYRLGETIYRTGESLPTLQSGANGYRLPGAREWEWAALGGVRSQGYTYSGSNDPEVVAWHWDNSSGSDADLFEGRGTWPVGRKAANELGIHDMSGNVWEYTEELSGASYRLRGGSWRNWADWSAVAFGSRISFSHNLGYFNLGLRVARNAP